MTCSKCGASNATIHLTQVMNGVRTTHDYCEHCAPFDLKQTTQQIKDGTFDLEAQWQAKWERLHAAHPVYAREAYSFVQKAISHDSLQRKDVPPQGSRKISQLLEGCQVYAKELYGESAQSQLEAWGIKTFLDVGEIFLLINSDGIKGKLSPDLEKRREEMQEQLRENLRQKYGEAPFLPD
jgi:uncharacterized repeat protein (TIGR04138 family)